MWDVSSACCLARAILEANDALAYLADVSDSAEMQHLRIQAWELHDQERRLGMLCSMNSQAPEVVRIQAEYGAKKSEILSSPVAQKLHQSVIGKIKKGQTPDFLLPLKERCARAGIDHDHYIGAKMFLSAYVHSYPFALHQLLNFRAGEEASLVVVSVPIRYTAVYLAKALELAGGMFGQCVPEPSDEEEAAVAIWAGIARDEFGGKGS